VFNKQRAVAALSLTAMLVVAMAPATLAQTPSLAGLIHVTSHLIGETPPGSIETIARACSADGESTFVIESDGAVGSYPQNRSGPYQGHFQQTLAVTVDDGVVTSLVGQFSLDAGATTASGRFSLPEGAERQGECSEWQIPISNEDPTLVTEFRVAFHGVFDYEAFIESPDGSHIDTGSAWIAAECQDIIDRSNGCAMRRHMYVEFIDDSPEPTPPQSFEPTPMDTYGPTHEPPQSFEPTPMDTYGPTHEPPQSFEPTPQASFPYEPDPSPLPNDANGDGIHDSIGAGFGQFNDGLGNYGQIVNRNGNTLLVSPDSEGVHIWVLNWNSSQPVELFVCGYSLFVDPGSEAVVACGSLRTHVLSGRAVVSLDGGITRITLPAGVTAIVDASPSGGYTVQHLDGTSAIEITVNGTTSTVRQGATTTVQSWRFTGYNAPLVNTPSINVAKAGQAIPLRWRLLDSAGNPVTNLQSAAVKVAHLECGLGTNPDPVDETATGRSGLLNLGNGNYQFNWSTSKTYANSCKVMHLDIGTGVTYQAWFRFNK